MSRQTAPKSIGLRTYHITFTTYGSWLLGDARGSTRHGGIYIYPDPALEEQMRERCNYDEIKLSEEARRVAYKGILEEARFRNWKIHVLNVLAKHVHVLVTAPCETSSSIVLARIKRGATEALKRAGYFKDRQIWTRSGDIKIINTPGYFHRVYNYILNEQTSKPFSYEEK